MSIVGVILNSVRGGVNGNNAPYDNPAIASASASARETVNMVQMQIGLLASAKHLQSDLRRLASSANTATTSGLQTVLQETTLSLLRQPELWVYANLETGDVPFQAAESTFNRLSITERSKLTKELTSNVSGQVNTAQAGRAQSGEADLTNEYIAVTVLVASKSKLSLSNSNTSEGLKNSLQKIGSISSTDLMALEVIWQPEALGDVLTAEELVTAYPNLKHL